MKNELLTLMFNAAAFSVLGVVVYVICFVAIDIMTPKIKIWVELVDKQNIAMAIFLGSIAIGISQVIAAAIHG